MSALLLFGAGFVLGGAVCTAVVGWLWFRHEDLLGRGEP